MTNSRLSVLVVTAAVVGAVLGYLILGGIGGGSGEGVLTLQEFKDIIYSNDVVAVLFTSTTCPYCKAVKPHWDELVREGRGGIVYVTVTFDPSLPREKLEKVMEIFDYYKVKSVPTLIVFKNGSVALVKEGLPEDKDEIYKIITRVLGG